MDKSGLILIGFFYSVIHEFGHLVTSYFLGYRAKHINIGCVNADIFLNIDNPIDKIIILLSGPFLNFVIALIFKLLYLYLGAEICNIVSFQNLFIGALNLFPIASLDGGQIVLLLLALKFDILYAERILNFISFIFLIPIFILGFWMLAVSHYNFSLLLLACYVFLYLVFREDIFCKE